MTSCRHTFTWIKDGKECLISIVTGSQSHTVGSAEYAAIVGNMRRALIGTYRSVFARAHSYSARRIRRDRILSRVAIDS